MTISNRLVITLYKKRMKSLYTNYKLNRFKDLFEIQNIILNSKDFIKSLKLTDNDIESLTEGEIKDLRKGLKECSSELFNRTYALIINEIFESIYLFYINKKEYEKIYEQCYRRSLLSELNKAIDKFGHSKKFIDVY